MSVTMIRFSRPKLAGTSSEFIDDQPFYNYLDPAEGLLAVMSYRRSKRAGTLVTQRRVIASRLQQCNLDGSVCT